jgi:hypothetical protein
LTVVTPHPANTRILIQKDSLSTFVSCSQEECINKIPDSYFVNPGTLAVKVYINDTLDNSYDFDINSYSTCKIPGCVFCKELYIDFICFPWRFKVLFVAVIIFLVFGVLVMLFCATKCFCALTCCGSCRDKVSTTTNVILKKVKGKRTKNSFDDEDLPDMEDNRDLGEIRLTRIRPNYGSNSGIQMFAVFLMFGLFAPAFSASCASGVTVPVSVQSCSFDGSIETCQLSLNNLVGIPSPGVSACLTFMSENQDVIAELTVEYVQSLEIAPLQTLYYTSSFAPLTQSIKACPWDAGCWDSTYCGSYDPSADPSAWGLLTGDVLLYEGQSRCDSQCGCAGCGCFSCDSSCVYSRAAIQPTGDIWMVSRPSAVQIQPRLNVTFISQEFNSTTTVDFLNLDTPVGENFTAN